MKFDSDVQPTYVQWGRVAGFRCFETRPFKQSASMGIRRMYRISLDLESSHLPVERGGLMFDEGDVKWWKKQI